MEAGERGCHSNSAACAASLCDGRVCVRVEAIGTVGRYRQCS